MKTLSGSLARTALALACVLSMAPVWAAQPTPRASADAAYQQDRAACLRSDSQHERTSCLREAAAVRAQGRAKTPPMVVDTPEARLQNALKRCTDLPPENKAICERMARGEGRVSGSVEGGGVIRELVTPVPAIPPLEPMPPAPTLPPAR